MSLKVLIEATLIYLNCSINWELVVMPTKEIKWYFYLTSSKYYKNSKYLNIIELKNSLLTPTSDFIEMCLRVLVLPVFVVYYGIAKWIKRNKNVPLFND